MKRIVLLVVFILLPVIMSGKDIVISIDGAFFKHDNSVRWEVYYMVADTMMKYIPAKDASFRGELDFHITISNSITTVTDDKWTISNVKNDQPDIHDLNLYGQRNYVFPKGQYQVKLKVTDPNDPERFAETDFKIVTPDYKGRILEISNIQLIELLKTPELNDTLNAQFIKGNKLLIPNTSAQLYSNEPRLKAYAELYLPAKRSGEIEINYELYDMMGRNLFRMPKFISDSSGLIRDYINIPVNIVATGAYNFYIKAIETDNPLDTAIASKKIFIVNPSIPPERNVRFTIDEEFERSEFAAMDDEQLDLEFRMSQDIMIKYERDQFDKLSTTKAKQRYLFRFWKMKDPDTETAINEFRLDFLKRVNYATTFFQVGHMPGWMTERGRVLLKYGIPEKRDKYPAQDMKKPAEVWFYPEHHGGAFFYFVDNNYSNNYYLVHSNVPGESYNLNWIQEYNPAIDAPEVISKFPKDYHK